MGSFAGLKRSEVELPAIMLGLDTADIESQLPLLEACLSAGTTAVVLNESPGSDGGGELYETACMLKEYLRGRAALLIGRRADIAGAAGAEGVVLDSQSLPSVAARRALQGSFDEGTSLVVKRVTSAAEAKSAERDGVDVVILDGADAPLAEAVRGAVSVPVLLGAPSLASLSTLPLQGMDGLLCPLPTDMQSEPADVRSMLVQLRAQLTVTSSSAPSEAEASVEVAPKEAEPVSSFQFISEDGEAMIEEVRLLLAETIAFLEEVVPGLPELGLVRDAAASLDELFLVVVVGEFNAGKSSVINALLGGRFLREGVLPTTNEISVLRYGAEESVEKEADGYYKRYLPADLLKSLNVVDTPGTNVILERQQKITEEFVPRADLVLFVISADRPFTESEVNFLKYIKKWDKKVVYILNKADILQPNEVEEVIEFVRKNSTQVLGAGNSTVIPVSAKSALEAKCRVGGTTLQANRGFLGTSNTSGVLAAAKPDPVQLAADSQWEGSGFGAAEQWVFNFLAGGGEEGEGEALRLKLNTPLAVASALMDACERQLEEEMKAAEAEVRAAKQVQIQLANFEQDMLKDAAIQRRGVANVVAAAAARAEALVDRVLRLSNFAQLSSYVLSGGSSKPVLTSYSSEVVATSQDDLQAAIAEHSDWLASNCDQQVSTYLSYVSDRGFPATAKESDDQESTAMVAVGDFDQSAAALLLEEEVREAVSGTVGTASGATAVGLTLTAILPTTAEDLLAMTVASLVAYVGVLNLPLKRSEAKAKVRRSASKFADEIEADMEKEAVEKLEQSLFTVCEALKPWEAANEEEVERVKQTAAKQRELQAQLKALQTRVRRS
eukprot:CAMPEP_0114258020 /NCGR_PEP_ID=MMETSP0058-20121206/19067_1 /TAXON_ID=36894 /ORGANISM="Pyramimonas parkeae, CCMP726" /LENGTH=840 /DNA_ID=CAMNT_0001372833 /DNA_START=335 /DNA_END=2857 /DNA_ORIENTATION=+